MAHPHESGPVELGSAEFNTMPANRPPPLPLQEFQPETQQVSSTMVATSAPASSRKAWLATVLVGVAGVTAAFLLWTRGEDAATALHDAEAGKKVAEDEAAAKSRDLAELNAKAERLERENAELVVLKQQLAEDLERLQATQKAMQEKMKGEIDAGDVAVVNDGGRLRVDLIDKVLFESGEAEISKRGEEVLAKVGAVLVNIDDKVIQVAGHTDDSPPTAKIKDRFATNWELSVARAANVVRFLQEKANVKGKHLIASGHSQYAPVATNNNPKGRAKNRRIEILLVPQFAPQKAAPPPK